ncbi:MAG: peptide-methionine (S)-S-oxide reductase MsrA [Fimbriimonadales bacterium]|nr:peptide-methionine (S)-S-oxide reductase MsrA [Fimbriimonadales bacterium]
MFLASVALFAALSGGGTPERPKHETLVVGGGCFWCLEAMFDELQGVVSAESGYAGGDRAGVTYEEVCTGTTGHAEVVRIEFDPKAVSREDLLRLFFTLHDPTQLNRQGPDYGPQYRSVVFYANEEEKRLAEKVRDEIAKARIWPRPIVTTLEPLRNYTRAEEYHQDYFRKFESASPAQRLRMNAGYCAAVIEPKVREFRRKHEARLKVKAGR